jgi:hypothetical protein
MAERVSSESNVTGWDGGDTIVLIFFAVAAVAAVRVLQALQIIG